MEPVNEEKYWQIARKRAAFKKSLFSYIVINAFLWAIWWMTVGRTAGVKGYPWPVWVMLAWGVGLGFQYFEAYNGSKQDMVQQEYERLKKDQ
ncbi:2TM domain-containing protein [Sediminibacterium ginsengisoli]|uniref:2TM domain-containing protein n=1 Tax=Sediminibacterium ginsengisoli TaxID=413434 RepID=A0A1T4RGN8_9BACT|nr:2TM domain-containing protein [Sediminibacterium ginsengisoli]SKA15162.1 2TM domain-containing protein [Sediminibacterium ginsengisoli]